MSSTEQDRVHRIMEDMAHGNSVSDKFKYNPATGLIEVTGKSDPDCRDLRYIPEDYKFSGEDEKSNENHGVDGVALNLSQMEIGEVRSDTCSHKDIAIIEKDSQDKLKPIYSIDDFLVS